MSEAQVDSDTISEASTMYTDCEIRQRLVGSFEDDEDDGSTFQSQAARRMARKFDFLFDLCVEVFSTIRTLSKEDIEENIKKNLSRKAVVSQCPQNL